MKVTNDKYINVNSIYKTGKINSINGNKKQTKSDSVQISELGKYLSKVNSREENIDMDKVNKLKQKIESGTYKVDSRLLAKKIVEKL